MKEIILIKNGELALKGLNRNVFEDTLIRNLRRRLGDIGPVQIQKSQSTITIEPQDDSFDFEKAIRETAKVFGIAGFSRCCVCEKDLRDICEKSVHYLEKRMQEISTFKVESKRSDKKFPYTSPELSREVGAALLEAYPHLRVDVHHPDEIVRVEVRENAAFVHAGQLPGAGGLPVGTAGKASVLISGGIDSPVAAYMMAKRGLVLDAIHFASPPYTSELAEKKVCDLLKKVSAYAGDIRLAIVPFTEIQEQIAELCPEEYFTLIMRRMMMRIACRLARENGSLALITGESLGQVASQTLPAICSVEPTGDMPVLRPLIGMDKSEIVRISREIDTFETSILPYEDCCTVFTPKHPMTRPTDAKCRIAEEKLDIEHLVEQAVAETRFLLIQRRERRHNIFEDAE